MKQKSKDLPVEITQMLAGWKCELDAARQVLRDEMAAFQAWVALQKGAPVAPVAAAPMVQAPAADSVAAEAAPAREEELTEEILMVLSAAVAAVFGKKARIRRARLSAPLASSAWAQQGRVFVQASHNLGMSHR